jgi:hypothetical protein
VGKIRVFSIKVALATMCAGKLMDKLRCKYSVIVSILFGDVKQTFTGFRSTFCLLVRLCNICRSRCSQGLVIVILCLHCV